MMKDLENDKYNKDVEEIVKLYRRLKALGLEQQLNLITGVFVFGVLSLILFLIAISLFLSGLVSGFDFVIVVIFFILAALFITGFAVYKFLGA